MNSVGDLIDVDLPLLWHEAVAVVQEVASHLSADRGVPAYGELRFNDDGTMTVGAASAGRMTAVTALARLLQRLLPEDAPASLVAFAAENSADQPTHPTLDAFTAALAFFERPGRAAHLLGVATRLQNYVPPAPTEEELARLRKKVADGSDEPTPAAPAARRSIRPAYAAGGALALVAVVAVTRVPLGPVVAALSRVSLPAAITSSPIATAKTAADSTDAPGATAEPANEKVDVEAPHAPDARARRAASHRAPSATATRAAARVAASAVPASVAASAVSAPSHEANDRSRGEPSKVAPAVMAATPEVEAAPHFDATKVYSSVDTSVTPAALVRPQLPTEPTPGPDTGLFDLTVDETGHVVAVRLLSPFSRYEERSLVSAAKAWRFRPALLDGHPVKYRLRVPINVPGQQ